MLLKESLLLSNKSKQSLFYSSYPIAKFDLSLSVHENEEELGIGIDYATDLVEAETIKRMGDHFKELIEGILSNPTQEYKHFLF